MVDPRGDQALMPVKQKRNKLIKNLNDVGLTGTKGVSFNVFLCWLLVWSGTLGYHDRKEKLFLARQA
jgi:hypothetical protein